MDDIESAVVVKDLYKSFKLPHEQHNGLKQAALNLFKGHRGYEVQSVLEDISFEVKKGDFFGIVGRNGSGKSTLLKLLAGIYAPDEGLVQVNGSLTPFIELGVGFNPELTGRENVYMNGALLGFDRKEVDAMYGDIVEFAELDKFMDQKLKNYSSGMQVRLAFSIAIRSESDVLLFDEVLAVGDAAFQQKCYEMFANMHSSGKTIILVTHDMSAVQRFCNKALLIENGKIKLIGDPFEVADTYKEANIEGEKNTKNNTSHKSSHELIAKISSKNKENITVDFNYTSTTDDEMYIGISVILNGISIAEITTSLDKPLIGSGKLIYTLSKDRLNGGMYNVTAALFKKETREPLAINNVKNTFKVDGYDISRGGALKLEDTWVYEK